MVKVLVWLLVVVPQDGQMHAATTIQQFASKKACENKRSTIQTEDTLSEQLKCFSVYIPKDK